MSDSTYTIVHRRAPKALEVARGGGPGLSSAKMHDSLPPGDDGDRPLDAASLEGQQTGNLPTADLGLPKTEAGLTDMESLVDQLDTEPNTRRGARRHKLRSSAVQVELDGGARGRLRDASVTGGMFIEGLLPPPHVKRLKVEAKLSSGHTMSFAANVLRRAEDGVGIGLEVDPAGQAFLNVFIAVAREHSDGPPLLLRIAQAEAQDEVAVKLGRLWHDVLLQPADNETNERFINACLSAGRLDVATARYREALDREPSFAARLTHIGKLLSFAAFAPRQSEPQAAKKKTGSAAFWGLLLIFAAISVVAILYVRLHRRPPVETDESLVPPSMMVAPPPTVEPAPTAAPEESP